MKFVNDPANSPYKYKVVLYSTLLFAFLLTIFLIPILFNQFSTAEKIILVILCISYWVSFVTILKKVEILKLFSIFLNSIALIIFLIYIITVSKEFFLVFLLLGNLEIILYLTDYNIFAQISYEDK